MPYKEKTRQFWLSVADNKCQYEYYEEKHGWVECNKRAKHIHHIIPEGKQIHEGEDSEHSVALPLCEYHHVRNLRDDEHTRDFAFHPDMGRAYRDYPEWKRRNEHMAIICESRAKKVIPSPFEEALQGHREMEFNGERYWAGTDEIDEYYIDKMRNKATMYLAEHPLETKPDTTPHMNYNPSKKKRWWNI